MRPLQQLAHRQLAPVLAWLLVAWSSEVAAQDVLAGRGRDVVSPALRQAMDDTPSGEQLKAYVVLSDQLSGRDLSRRTLGTSGRTRRGQVVQELKAHASQTQVEVRSVLDAAEAAGQAELLSVLWMGNAVLFSGEAAVIQRLAELPGVDRIRAIRPGDPSLSQDTAAPQPPLPALAASPAPVVNPALVPSPAPVVPAPLAPAALAPAPAFFAPASYPFFDDFDGGVLLPHWSVATTGSGYVSVTSADGPYAGQHLVMGTSVNAVDSTASITVELDLSGQTDVGIRFRQKEFGDENHAEDGVFVSDDGLVWHEVFSLQDGSDQYMPKWVSLDPLLAGFGISFTSSFFVRFQWRDNFDIPSDGFAFDEIEIGPGVGVKPPPDIEVNLTAIQVPLLWDLGITGSGVLIGSIDAGVTWMHPDLINRIWTNPGEIAGNLIDDDLNGFVDDIQGWDFLTDSNDVTSNDSHGTNSAGLMVGDGSQGRATGAAPGATLVVCEIDDETDYWQAQQYLLDVGVDVISSSYSYKWPAAPDYRMHRLLCEVELAAGIIHANSIGNQGVLQATHPIPFNISTPGNCPSPFTHPDAEPGGHTSVLACGGIQLPGDALYNPSGRGPAAWEDILLYDPAYPHAQDPAHFDYPAGGFPPNLPGLIKPDLVTYTNSVMTTALNTGYANFSGTSAATPQLGGVLCLLREAQPAASPRLLAGALELTAIDLGSPGKDNLYGAGKVAAYNAARRLQLLASFDPPVLSPGDPFALDLVGEPGAGVFVWYQADITATTGNFNLLTPVILLAVDILDAGGLGGFNLVLPNDPGFIGLTFWIQAGALPKGDAWGSYPFFSVPDSLTIVP